MISISSLRPMILFIFTKVRPAGAGLAGQGGDIAGAVTDERQRLFRDGGKNQLAGRAFGKYLAGVRVNDLGDEKVLVDVHSLLRAAFVGNCGAHDLRKAVDVMRLDAEQIFDAAAHLLGPWLGAEHAIFQRNLRKRNPRITQRLTEKQRIRGSAAEHRRMKIPEDLKLAFGVAGRGRNHRSADFSRAVMQASPAGKQPIAIGDVHKIAGISAPLPVRARAAHSAHMSRSCWVYPTTVCFPVVPEEA